MGGGGGGSLGSFHTSLACSLLTNIAPCCFFFSSQTHVDTGVARTTTSATELAVKIKVNVGDGEPIESALRRFKRAVSNSGHLMELRHKRYFENSQERAIRKVKEARMRIKFERMQRRRMANRT